MTVRRFPARTAVYLSCGHVDMRKSINGLAAVVQGTFELDPFQGALFVFCNKNKDKIKVLHWDKDGFALYYKRRERGRFCWPSLSENDGTANVTINDLNRLLDGLLMEKFIPHKNYTVL
jgi:transposase